MPSMLLSKNVPLLKPYATYVLKDALHNCRDLSGVRLNYYIPGSLSRSSAKIISKRRARREQRGHSSRLTARSCAFISNWHWHSLLLQPRFCAAMTSVTKYKHRILSKDIISDLKTIKKTTEHIGKSQYFERRCWILQAIKKVKIK